MAKYNGYIYAVFMHLVPKTDHMSEINELGFLFLLIKCELLANKMIIFLSKNYTMVIYLLLSLPHAKVQFVAKGMISPLNT